MNYIERDERIQFLRENLTESALYEQLAEESAELAQASLKYLRAVGNGNPTPVSIDEALSNLVEEAGDVYLCMTVVNLYVHSEQLDKKLERWYERVKRFTDEQ